jgi:glycerophosphoryl diester phosphodiesterase
VRVAPKVAAHRGGARLWPENSLRGFRESFALGADLVELAVHLAIDGALPVIHDATLRRTTDRRGRVRTRTGAELRQARLRGPDRRLTTERLPMLEDVLGIVAASEGGVLVEVKVPGRGLGVRYLPRARIRPGARYQGIEERVIAALSRARLLERANIMSFNPAVIERARALAPNLRTTLLVSTMHIRLARARAADTVAWARRFGATDVGLNHTLVDDSVIAAAHAAGVKVGAWTVNDEPEMRRLTGLGVDVLTSDRPDLVLRTLGRA